MPIQMDLRRIIISEVDEHQVIVLREVDGDRSFPIIIGLFEAANIDRRVKGIPSPRPLTHDLIAAIIDNMNGTLQDIVINELKNNTYYARLRIRQDGELIEVDCRPSDAITVAVATKVPIYVNEEVLGDALDE
ncbi:MAG: bifunctional nuclease family protein [Bacteroidales bacterium]|nr:bifunctional nuclease family protein [Bacteroidales bacterium]